MKFPVRKGWCILSDKRRQSTIAELLFLYGRGVLTAPNMQTERKYVQHRHVSCFEHSVAVAYMSIWIARRLRLRADLSSLVRGALLHDYFLYDWRCREASPRLHGLRHPRIALDNARRDFSLTPREEDIICKHMFPLTLRPPRYKESVVVTCADKICAVGELLDLCALQRRVDRVNRRLYAGEGASPDKTEPV